MSSSLSLRGNDLRFARRTGRLSKQPLQTSFPARHVLRTRAATFDDVPGSSLLRRFWHSRGKENGIRSLEQRISTGEFSRQPFILQTQSMMKTLAELGPLGKTVADQITRLHSRSSQASLPEATGSLAEMVGKPFFEPLYELHLTYGGIFKLTFGPRSFVIVSDPLIAKEILSTSAEKYSKGILSDILEFVMGNGLIPADGNIWLERRRAILPSLHKAFLENMIQTFSQCANRGLQCINESVQRGEPVEVEGLFSRIALDIIGRAVFNYDFDAVTHDDPVIQAVYTVLREAESRSLAPFPFWKLPFIDALIPQQRKVKKALAVLNETIERLILNVHKTMESDHSFDTSNLSVLHFLIASGQAGSAQQLRDDLMTLLIAGHETTAAVLTWTFHELSTRPHIVRAMQEEIDRVMADRPVTSSALLQLDLCTRVLAESMRLYPQPPVLIRQALESTTLGMHNIPKGTDLFISIWNLHRSPSLWENPEAFDPDRFPRGAGMPSEFSNDFKYLPFGGGRRKCIGSQFALLESLQIVASILRRYDFEVAQDAPEVHLTTGATIHSTNGVHLQFSKRRSVTVPPTFW